MRLYREWKINIFILLPLLAALAGSPSLGLVVTGLTGLIWGTGSGSLFIGVTTTLMLIFTGNINMELIFLYTLTLAYLIEGGFIPGLQNRTIVYPLLTFISLLLIPIWKQLLGSIPVSLLNELNVAGSLLVIAGLLIFIFRIRLLLKARGPKEKLLEALLVFICSLTGLMGSILTIPLWLGANYFLRVFTKYEWKFNSLLFQRGRLNFALTVIILLLIVYVLPLLLPYGFFTTLLLFFIPYLFFRHSRDLPTVELVYFSMILGIVACKTGILL
ncbi:MAG: hypothetical protein GX336_05040 [Halanaerobiaceae bacterium]|nr:hypothetical protein [Halanaerobiaceae bacterium]